MIADYRQVAVLLPSVRDGVSGPYLDGLETAGVPARCDPGGHIRAPTGDEVLVTTIHQAKGREWDVVVVGSLSGPDLDTDPVGRNLAEYCGALSGEPAGSIADFDRARRHYVAFTRASNLLVLTTTGRPKPRFSSIRDGAERWHRFDRESLARQRFRTTWAEPPQTVVAISHLDRLVITLVHPRGVDSRRP